MEDESPKAQQLRNYVYLHSATAAFHQTLLDVICGGLKLWFDRLPIGMHSSSNNPYSDLSSCLRPSIHKSCSPSLLIRLSALAKVLPFRL